MTKRKRTNSDLQNIHIKLKIKQHEPHYKPSVKSGDTRRVTPFTNPAISHECGNDRIVNTTNGTYINPIKTVNSKTKQSRKNQNEPLHNPYLMRHWLMLEIVSKQDLVVMWEC